MVLFVLFGVLSGDTVKVPGLQGSARWMRIGGKSQKSTNKVYHYITGPENQDESVSLSLFIQVEVERGHCIKTALKNGKN